MQPLIVFAKAPVAGRVKTRLIEALGPDGAADLHRALVGDVLEEMSRLFAVELHTDAATSEWPEFEGVRRLQQGEDLGERMIAALHGGLARGWERAVLIGSDAVTLSAETVATAFGSDADVVFGPSEDGGFYLVAARRLTKGMFAGVEWSTGRELQQAKAGCLGSGLSVGEIVECWDVDRPTDLYRLSRDFSICSRNRTYEFLNGRKIATI
jgi:hypothetical protein